MHFLAGSVALSNACAGMSMADKAAQLLHDSGVKAFNHIEELLDGTAFTEMPLSLSAV